MSGEDPLLTPRARLGAARRPRRPPSTTMTVGVRAHDPLRATVKLAYGVGALGDSIKTFCFTTFLLFYYTTVLGLPGTLLAVAMSVGLVWDAAVDPLIGHLSDGATVRFGRRHTFMLAGAVCAGASLMAVFNPPSGLSTGGLFAWLMVSSLCLRSSNSLFMVPYYALGAELTTDYHERTSVSGYRAGAVLTGTLLATGTAFLVFLPNQGTAGQRSKFAPGSYEAMGVAFGLAITVVGLVATVGTLRERYRLGSSPAVRTHVRELRRTIQETLQDPSFRALVSSSSLSFMAGAINAALAMHFLTYHAGVSSSEAMTLYFAGFYAGALAGVVTWVRVTRRIGKHHVYSAAMLVSALLVSCGYWLVGEGRPFGTGHVPVLVVGTALAGFFGTAAAVVAPSMMADVTARDELLTGRRRDGVFFGIYSFGQQLSAGLAVLMAGVLVDRFARLVPAQAVQSTTTVERLAIISSLLPAALLAVAGIIALRYRLTRQQVQSTQYQLAVSAHRSPVADDR
jgi:GPH family glycoside/pentoside/hexuronide:cation symporter